MRKSAGVTLVAATIAVATLGACDPGSDNGKSDGCETKGRYAEYNRCDLNTQDQAYAEATVGRAFEVEGFGVLKIGQKVKVVCYDSTSAHGSFGIVIPQGNGRDDGKWTLGRIDGEPFAYVGQIIGAAFEDVPGASRELQKELDRKLDDKFDGTAPVDSCDDRRVIIGDAEKAELLQQ